MNFKNQFFRFILYSFISFGWLHTSVVLGTGLPVEISNLNNQARISGIDSKTNIENEAKQLNKSLENLLAKQDTLKGRFAVGKYC